MGRIKGAIQNQIDNTNRLQFTDTTGTILKYDRTTETCTVKYLNPNGSGYIVRQGVKLLNSAGGLSSSGYQVGQKCSISFINANIYNPIVTGIAQSYYAQRSCTDQGAYIADDEVYKVGTPEHIIAMNLNWIDDSNQNLYKYQNELGAYQTLDVDEVSMDLITTLDKYQDNEVGITNLNNKSCIKLRDNGDIDIFTENNTGIRICKTGNIKIYGKDVEFTDNLSDTTDKSISTQLTVAQVMKICVAYDIIKEIDVYAQTIEEDINDAISLNGDES